MMDMWLPRAASSYAHQIDYLILFITVIVGIWFAVAESLLLYMCVRFRRRPGIAAAYLPGTSRGAMAWVLVPCVVILGFDLVIDATAAPVWEEIKEQSPAPELTVRATGEQWAWRFTYPGPDGRLDTEDDIDKVNELHLPVDRVVVFDLNAKDVLHSFFIPELRFKQDVLPGRTIKGWLKPTLVGEFPIVCAEICGFGHTLMQSRLVVEDDASFEQWLASGGVAVN